MCESDEAYGLMKLQLCVDFILFIFQYGAYFTKSVWAFCVLSFLHRLFPVVESEFNEHHFLLS